LNLGWQNNKRKEFGDPSAPEVSGLFFDLLTMNYHAAYHFDHNRGWNTSVGINGMAQKNRNRGEEVLIPEYALVDVGGFVYTSKTIGKTSLSGGIRFDNRSLDADLFNDGTTVRFKAFKKNFSNVSASVGVSYTPTEQSVWKLNIARGFRAPSIPELASNGAHEGTNRYEYGDDALHSERSLQADLGWEANSEHISASASLFINGISDFIFYSKLAGSNSIDSLVEVDGEWIPAFQFGQRNANLYGGEFMIDLHPHPFDWLHWQNTISYVRGKFVHAVDGVDNLPLIPSPRWISEWRAELLPSGKLFRNLLIHFEVDYNFRQSHPFTAFSTETATPSYTLLNAGISSSVVLKKKTLFSFYFNAMNIGDLAYQTHLSRLKYTAENPVTGRRGVYNMGRNFSLKLNIPISF
jgi:iron complex outermembrane receptor protein